MITLTVPFVYEAIVIKPRCRKPSLITIKDEVEVQIKTSTLAKLPVAFKVGANAIRWDGERLWNYYLESAVEQLSRQVSLDEVIKNTKSNGATYKWSCSGAAAPFKNFWHDLRWSNERLGAKHNIKECGFDKWVEDDDVLSKADATYREWVEDNREAVISKLNRIVSGIMAVDGTMFCLASEPRYEVNSFGAGHNYSVAMFVSYGYNPNISSKCYFSSTEFEKAQAALMERSPDKNQKAEPNGGHRIEVLITEAVKCNPQRDHVA